MPWRDDFDDDDYIPRDPVRSRAQRIDASGVDITPDPEPEPARIPFFFHPKDEEYEADYIPRDPVRRRAQIIDASGVDISDQHYESIAQVQADPKPELQPPPGAFVSEPIITGGSGSLQSMDPESVTAGFGAPPVGITIAVIMAILFIIGD